MRMGITRVSTLSCVATTLLLASTALANDAEGPGGDARRDSTGTASSNEYLPETPEQEASRYFRRGIELFDEGNVQEALVQFLRSQETKASVAALRNASLCLTKLGRHDDALDKLERALQLPTATNQEIADVTAERDRLEASLGTLRLSTTVLDARVFVDQRDRGATPVSELRLNAGEHTVRVEKDGYVAFETVLSIVAGETRTLEVELALLPAPPPATSKPREPRPLAPLTLDSPPARPENPEAQRSSLRTGSWVSLGAGTLLVAAGAGAYVLRQRDLNELARSCEKLDGSEGRYNCASASPDRLGELKRRADRVDTLNTVAVTATGLGATALLLAGVGLVYTAEDEHENAPSARVGLWVAGTQAGISGRF